MITENHQNMIENEKRFSGGKVIIHLDIEDNIIKDIHF